MAPYVYQPVTLYFFHLFSLFNNTTAYYLFLTFKILLLVLLIYIWSRKILFQPDIVFYLLCLLSFNSAIYLDLAAGNISILEQFLIWTAFYHYLNRKIPQFCLFIILASLFKITPILFLLLLLFLEDKRKYKFISGSVLIFLFVFILSYFLNPFLFRNFINNVLSKGDEVGIINPSTFALIKDSTQKVSAMLSISIPIQLTSVIFLIVMGVLIYLSWIAFSRIQKMKPEDKDKIELFLACLLYALILPRFKDYSYILLIVPGFYLLKQSKTFGAYPFLFVLLILSVHHISLPLLDKVYSVIWVYYPLIIAYLVWGLYLYYVSNLFKRYRATQTNQNLKF